MNERLKTGLNQMLSDGKNNMCTCPGNNSPRVCNHCTAREDYESMFDEIEEFCGNCDKHTKCADDGLLDDSKYNVCEDCMCIYQEGYVRDVIIGHLEEIDSILSKMKSQTYSSRMAVVETNIYWLLTWLNNEFNWRVDTHDAPDIIHSIAKKEGQHWADEILVSNPSIKWRKTMKKLEQGDFDDR